ncbi:MAG: hypothetical protein MUF54_15125 [Polyangiaceae bacterium]|nr:hypothetical protein [Polyangiaceae bacterium]
MKPPERRKAWKVLMLEGTSARRSGVLVVAGGASSTCLSPNQLSPARQAARIPRRAAWGCVGRASSPNGRVGSPRSTSASRRVILQQMGTVQTEERFRHACRLERLAERGGCSSNPNAV